MLLLPETITLTNGQEIPSSEIKLKFEDNIYFLTYLDNNFPISNLNGVFFSGVSSITSAESNAEPIFISDQTLDEITKLNS